MEPNCQSCHTGTATHNNGQIRYTSVVHRRQRRGARGRWTRPSPPPRTRRRRASRSYRFSLGHGGLQCAACHGSTHAEFPTSRSATTTCAISNCQGHAGVMAECTACHATVAQHRQRRPARHAPDRPELGQPDTAIYSKTAAQASPSAAPVTASITAAPSSLAPRQTGPLTRLREWPPQSNCFVAN